MKSVPCSDKQKAKKDVWECQPLADLQKVEIRIKKILHLLGHRLQTISCECYTPTAEGARHNFTMLTFHMLKHKATT